MSEMWPRTDSLENIDRFFSATLPTGSGATSYFSQSPLTALGLLEYLQQYLSHPISRSWNIECSACSPKISAGIIFITVSQSTEDPFTMRTTPLCSRCHKEVAVPPNEKIILSFEKQNQIAKHNRFYFTRFQKNFFAEKILLISHDRVEYFSNLFDYYQFLEQSIQHSVLAIQYCDKLRGKKKFINLCGQQIHQLPSAPREITSVITNENNSRKVKNQNQNSYSNSRNLSRDGIPNLGNTCYINTALQILFQVLNFSKTEIIRTQINASPDRSRGSSLLRILIDIKQGVNIEVAITNLIQYLNQFYKTTDYYQQSDCVEFLIALIQEIKEGFPIVLEDIAFEVEVIIYRCSVCNYEFLDKRAEGTYYYINTENNLAYDIDAFHRFMVPIKSLNCERCRKLKAFRGERVLRSFPNHALILIPSPREQAFQLRYSWTKGEIHYSMMCFSVHMGTKSSGHYVFVKREEDKWIYVSDDQWALYQFDRNNNLRGQDKITCMVFSKINRF